MMPTNIFVHTIVIFVDITVHPIRNITVSVGNNVALICKASGADNLKYQWMRMKEKNISSRAIGVHSNTLIIPNIWLRTEENINVLYLVVILV